MRPPDSPAKQRTLWRGVESDQRPKAKRKAPPPRPEVQGTEAEKAARVLLAAIKALADLPEPIEGDEGPEADVRDAIQRAREDLRLGVRCLELASRAVQIAAVADAVFRERQRAMRVEDLPDANKSIAATQRGIQRAFDRVNAKTNGGTS